MARKSAKPSTSWTEQGQTMQKLAPFLLFNQCTIQNSTEAHRAGWAASCTQDRSMLKKWAGSSQCNVISPAAGFTHAPCSNINQAELPARPPGPGPVLRRWLLRPRSQPPPPQHCEPVVVGVPLRHLPLPRMRRQELVQRRLQPPHNLVDRVPALAASGQQRGQACRQVSLHARGWSIHTPRPAVKQLCRPWNSALTAPVPRRPSPCGRSRPAQRPPWCRASQ